MKRNAFKMKLKTGGVGEYKERHDGIWSELAKAHTDAGIFDYSIRRQTDGVGGIGDGLFGLLFGA